MTLDRRSFLAWLGAAGAGTLAGASASLASIGQGPSAGRPRPGPGSIPSVLVDVSRCVGCRGCEAACSEANGLPPPEGAGSRAVFEKTRETSQAVFTVVNRQNSQAAQGGPFYVKRQCMHCLDAACVSACPVRALRKSPEGAVVYDETLCIGCRYCMVACPFGVPKYEYESRLPRVRKCTFCQPRLERGLAPACAQVCPSGALTFGSRDAMLGLARRRIGEAAGRLSTAVYGEREAGGTAWLYLLPAGAGLLGLPAVRGASYARLTSGALFAVPVIALLGPPALLGLRALLRARERSRNGQETAASEAGTDGGEP